MFLLGHWQNYEELEETLSLPELMATLTAAQEAEYRRNKFMAALKGIDLDKESGKGKEVTELEAIYRKAYGDDPETNDIANLKGDLAAKDGFGIGMGLGYEEG